MQNAHLKMQPCMHACMQKIDGMQAFSYACVIATLVYVYDSNDSQTKKYIPMIFKTMIVCCKNCYVGATIRF